ncbi:O-antigen ligase family protein [Clostridium culturomicium]|uniref:O-antigen ligase family protein n=1 Tax=Clostridium culturomicium TaxID=1499683 RepID=UPI00058FD181|nr:O-antigen ligase family protein [Clostridium culturomicium]
MKNNIDTRENLSKYAASFVMMLIIIQPMLDVLSYWLIKGDNTSITTILRILMLGVIVIYSFIISDNKKFYFVFYGVMAAFWALHMINGFRIGYISLFSDIALFIRVAQMPALTLSFITFLRKNKNTKKAIYEGCCLAFVIVIGVICLSYITNTPDYMYYGVGIKGWFYSGNAQSIIVTVLVCMTLLFTYRTRNKFIFIMGAFFGFGLLFSSGTRVTFFSIFIIAIGILVLLVFNKEKSWIYYTTLVLVMLICGGFFNISPMVNEKDKMHAGFEAEQEKINASINNSELKMEYGEDKEIPGKPYTLNQYKKIYEPYLWMYKDAIDEFGFEKFLEEYDYTTEAEQLGNNRLYKQTIARIKWEQQDFLTKLVGYESATVNLNGSVYMPENDLPILLYFNGYIGFGLYVLFIAYFAVLALVALIKNFKNVFTVETGLVGIAIMLVLGSSLLSGYLVERPNVSIYLSMMLAVVYSITVIENGVNPYLGLKKYK